MNNNRVYILLLFLAVIFSNGCSRSGRKKRWRDNLENNLFPTTETSEKNQPVFDESNKTVIRLIHRGGVYYLPLEVNGVKIDFILDTGASCISISERVLKKLIDNDVISENDVTGMQEFTDANGDVNSAVKVNLKKITIGNSIERNVEAAIISGNNVDCLLGQSWLNRFGRVSIDYDNLLLILEK